MSPRPLPLRAVSATDVGRVRDHQEDTALVATIEHPNGRYQLLLVADGMGGGVKGEVASALASETVLDFFRTSPWYNPALALKDAAAAANAAVFDKGTGGGQATRSLMGTTLVAALVEELTGKCWLVNVGDSRADLLSGGVLQQITQDHSLVAERIRAGMEPLSDLEHAEWKNTITRAIGIEGKVEADVSKTPFELKDGDRLLLCSDGLHGMVDNSQLAQLLSQRDPEAAARAMVLAANAAGGRDNISVVIGALGDAVQPVEAALAPITVTPGRQAGGVKPQRGAVVGRQRRLPAMRVNPVLLVAGVAVVTVAGVLGAATLMGNFEWRFGGLSDDPPSQTPTVGTTPEPPTTVAATATPTVAPSPTPTVARATPHTYTIKNGDSLGKIAEAAGVSVADILKANAEANSDTTTVTPLLDTTTLQLNDVIRMP